MDGGRGNFYYYYNFFFRLHSEAEGLALLLIDQRTGQTSREVCDDLHVQMKIEYMYSH